jgi:proteasome accessory factor A
MYLGHETEYGIAAQGCDPGTASLQLLQAAHSLPHLRVGGNGGVFLANGCRFYVDCSHPEIATAEVDNPFEAVTCLLAGDELLRQLATQVAPGDGQLRLFKTNVCQHAQTTYAAHESYSHRCSPTTLPKHLLPFLASRIILTGAGGLSLHPGIEFVLSPRVAFLTQDVGASSTSERGIFHTKDEPLAGPGWHRLHVLCGDGLCSHQSNLLRIGPTALIVALLDRGFRLKQPFTFADTAVQALQVFNSDPGLKVKAGLKDGRQVSALDIQREYLRFAEEHSDGTVPEWAGQVRRIWRATLDLLEHGPGGAATALDWAIKHKLYVQHARRRGYSMEEISRWNRGLREKQPQPPAGELNQILEARARLLSQPSPRRIAPVLPKAAADRLGLDPNRLAGFLKLRAELCELEIRFSELGAKGLFNQLDARGLLAHRLPQVTEQSIQQAVHNPPAMGRARLRGRLVRQLASQPERYLCDWQSIFDLQETRKIDLSNPGTEQADWAPCDRSEMPNADLAGFDRVYSRADAAFRQGDYNLAAALLSSADGLVAALPRGVQQTWYELLAFSEARRGQGLKARRACRLLADLLGRDRFTVCATIVSTLRFCGLVPHPKINVWLNRGTRMLTDPNQAQPLNEDNVISFTYHFARTLTVQGQLEKARLLIEPFFSNSDFLAQYPRMASRARCDFADTLRRLGARDIAREHLQQALDLHQGGGFEGDLADHSLAGMIKIGDETEAREALAKALTIQQRLKLPMGWARSLCLGARRFPDIAKNERTVSTLQRLGAKTPSLKSCRVFGRIMEKWSDWVSGAPHPEIDDFYWGL